MKNKIEVAINEFLAEKHTDFISEIDTKFSNILSLRETWHRVEIELAYKQVLVSAIQNEKERISQKIKVLQ